MGTLLYERPIDHPDGTVQGAGHSGARLVWSWRGVLVPEGLDPGQQKDEHSDHGDGSGNAGPHSQVKGCEEREDVDLLLWLAQQNAHGVVHVALAEVYHVLPLRRDGDGRHRHVRSLTRGTETRKLVYK